MKQDSFTLLMGPVSLALLTSVIQRPLPPGLNDPFMGLLADEIERQLEQAVEEISAKGFWEILEDGTVIIDEKVHTVIEIATSAPSIVIASRGDPDGNASLLRIIYLGSDLIVEQEAMPNGQIAFTIIQDLATLIQRLKDFFALRDVPAGPSHPLIISEGDLTEAKRLSVTKGKTACSAFLEQKTVPPEIATALAEALADNSGLGTLSVLRRDEGKIQYVENLGWLLGLNGSWCLRPSDQQIPLSICLVPAEASQIWQQIINLVTKEIQRTMASGQANHGQPE